MAIVDNQAGGVAPASANLPERRPVAALTASGVSKSYGATVALRAAGITITSGQVHALLGENGAGKSTFVRILSGVETADAGEVYVKGTLYKPTSVQDARARHVATAFQELSLISNLTVAQNLLLPFLSHGLLGAVSARRDLDRAEEILTNYGLTHIDPRVSVSALSLANRQRLEITRALANAKTMLILDEPTAALPETTWLFDKIQQSVDAGVAVLYISHRLGEVREICTAATVLRSGETVATVGLDRASNDDIFEMMVGRKAEHVPDVHLTAHDHTNVPRMTATSLVGEDARDISFVLNTGEILGIAALDGQGQRGLFHMLAGLAKPRRGHIELDGKRFKVRSPRHALNFGSGVAYVPEERKTEGILENMPTASNVALSALRSRHYRIYVDESIERRIGSSAAAVVDLASRYLKFRISNLSGGNQQKAVLARVIATGAKTLLLFDPTRGVDVGTKASLYTAIRAFAARGGSVLLYSSELSEIIRLCDPCIVLYQGKISKTLAHDELNEHNLVAAMSGYNSTKYAVKASA